MSFFYIFDKLKNNPNMKKVLAMLLIVTMVASCGKKKAYEEDIQGTWGIYKYTLWNGDKTANYLGTTITFDNGTYTVLDTIPDSTAFSGTYSFEEDGRKLVLSDTTRIMVDTTWVVHTNKLKYTVFNLTPVHMQLRTDSSETYFSKKD